MFRSLEWRDPAPLPAHQGHEDSEGSRRGHRRDRRVLRFPWSWEVGSRDSRGERIHPGPEAGKREEGQGREEGHQPRRPPAGDREVARPPRGSSARPHDVERVPAGTPAEYPQADLTGPRQVVGLACCSGNSGARPSGTAPFFFHLKYLY